ncbi:MAG: type II toxin-antitoxin system antitoxin, RelB/DinJ family [Clostridiaceae bacterium]|nr:type II toxin-antitoxin system antitoxin, RelB/DinJ family [Clostridiaceae bacterium]
MNMSTAINVFVRQSVRYGGIPFKITLKDDFFNEYNQKILQKSIEELNSGKGKPHELIEVDDE